MWSLNILYLIIFIQFQHDERQRQRGMYAPFLKLDLAPIRTGLCGDELLEVADGVVWAAFDAYWTGDTSVS